MVNIENLTFKYRGAKVPVFDKFSLSISESGIYGMLGNNGVGKTTLLYLISGLLHSKEGSVKVDGMESGKLEKKMLQQMYLVPEEFDLPPIKLSDYLRMFKPFYPNFSQEIMDDCMREFELDADIKLGELSMGTKKKVLICFALATNVRLLLLDEPTNGLDHGSKRQFRKVIAKHMTDDRIIVISTHQMHDVEMMLDHYLILGKEGILVNESALDISQKYAFGIGLEGETVYSTKTVDGEKKIVLRKEEDDETPIDIELFYEYITSKK